VFGNIPLGLSYKLQSTFIKTLIKLSMDIKLQLIYREKMEFIC